MSSKTIVRVLFLAALLLLITGLVAESVWNLWGRDGPLEILISLDLANDSAIPTWYSSLALLFCSILLAIIAAAKKRTAQPYILHWSFLSGILLLLSIDEVAAIHERAGNVLGYLVTDMGFTPSGFIYYFWVVPGTIFVLAVLLAYVRFLLHLPKRTRLLFLAAGGLFVAGALGVEMLASLQASAVGTIEKNATKNALEAISLEAIQRIPYSVRLIIEEGLEMLGVILFAYALMSYLSLYTEEVTLQIRTRSETK